MLVAERVHLSTINFWYNYFNKENTIILNENLSWIIKINKNFFNKFVKLVNKFLFCF
jgi:hypothetical protein